MHRDIKSENVIRKDKHGDWKLCDYGFIKLLPGGMDEFEVLKMTCVGTPLYMSPHMIDGKPCGIRSDIYSVGILLFELLF